MRRLLRGASWLGEHGGVRQDPVAAAGGVLDHRLGLTQFEDASLAHRLGEIVGDVTHSHADMQVPADLEDTLGIALLKLAVQMLRQLKSLRPADGG